MHQPLHIPIFKRSVASGSGGGAGLNVTFNNTGSTQAMSGYLYNFTVDGVLSASGTGPTTTVLATCSSIVGTTSFTGGATLTVIGQCVAIGPTGPTGPTGLRVLPANRHTGTGPLAHGAYWSYRPDRCHGSYRANWSYRANRPYWSHRAYWPARLSRFCNVLSAGRYQCNHCNNWKLCSSFNNRHPSPGIEYFIAFCGKYHNREYRLLPGYVWGYADCHIHHNGLFVPFSHRRLGCYTTFDART